FPTRRSSDLAVALAVAEHHLDLIAVLLAVGDHVIVLDALVGKDGDHPADQAAAEERHRALGTQIPRRLERQRAGSDALSPGETDADDFGHPEHVELILEGSARGRTAASARSPESPSRSFPSSRPCRSRRTPSLARTATDRGRTT